MHKSVDVVKAKCAKCHNPRHGTKVTDALIAANTIGLSTSLSNALEDETISEGINCLIYHNIDKINTKAPAHIQEKSSGPFQDANGPYHKTTYRKFFDKEPN